MDAVLALLRGACNELQQDLRFQQKKFLSFGVDLANFVDMLKRHVPLLHFEIARGDLEVYEEQTLPLHWHRAVTVALKAVGQIEALGRFLVRKERLEELALLEFTAGFCKLLQQHFVVRKQDKFCLRLS